jgi:redox-sensitive bicupin YhaK (pirin superfamily)
MHRFVTREPGRQTRHSFSFGSHYDPERNSFGPLVALNDDLLGSDSGYDAHRHADVVLVTWVVSGALAHDDDDGRVVQRPGELAVTRAGRGIVHAERADGVPTRFVQSWLRPDVPGGEPSRRTTRPDLSGGDLVVAAEGGELGVAGAVLRLAEIPGSTTVRVPAAARRYVLVVTGALTRSSLAEPLAAGDAFEVVGGAELELTTAVPTTVLAWSFAD